MKSSKKIAFVHYPHFCNAARLETMPFALNSVIALAKMGWNLDLYLWEKPSLHYQELLPENVTIHYSNDLDYSWSSRIFNRIRPLWLQVRFQKIPQYHCVFGLGQIGSYIASLIADASQCPFIYFNDEFPSCWRESQWSKLEKIAVQKAYLVVVPDERRFFHLKEELELNNKPYAVIPNIPIVQPLEIINWHQKLNLPSDSIPFLNAGTIAEWSQIPELLSTVPYWHEKAILILHSRAKEGLLEYRQQLSHLEIPHKVIWSLEPLTETQLNSLVAYCTGNLAFYRNDSPNTELMGFSSGKIMRSLAYGSPIIASQLSSLSFIEENQLGVLVKHPAEIPHAVNKVIANCSHYQQKCREFSQQISFEKSWSNLLDKLSFITINPEN